MKKIALIIVVLLGFFGCDDIVEVEDISGESVTVLAPTNGTVLTTTTVVFNWNTVTDAEYYKFQIATPNFENASQILVDSTMASTNFTIDLDYNSYEWRVKAKNSGYETTYTSQSFTVEE